MHVRESFAAFELDERSRISLVTTYGYMLHCASSYATKHTRNTTQITSLI